MSENNKRGQRGNKNVKDFSAARESIIESLNKTNKTNLAKDEKREVGGMVAVTEGTFTGEIKVIDANPKTGIRGYIAAMTENGEAISLQSLMGSKSFTGFEAGDFENQFDVNGETKSETVRGAYDKDFDEKSLDNRWTPKYWDLYDEAAELMTTGELKGKKFQRMAVLFKEFTARKEFTIGEQKVKPGHKRYIKATAWQLS